MGTCLRQLYGNSESEEFADAKHATDESNITIVANSGSLSSRVLPPPHHSDNMSPDALEWMEYAAALGSLPASFRAGVWRQQRGDLEEAAMWFTDAADRGEVQAKHSLGVCYKLGLGVDRDIDTSIQLFQEAAQDGDASAAFAVARIFGQDKRDLESAAKWFKYAAELGEIRAMFNLGLFYHRGLGVETDVLLAAKWYMAAAEGGSKDAEKNMVLLVKDHPEVLEEHEKEILSNIDENNFGESEPDLPDFGIVSKIIRSALNNVQTPKDISAAMGHLEKYVEAGEKEAIMLLAECYLAGVGVAKIVDKQNQEHPDTAQGISLMEHAAALHYAPALHRLAQLYLDGISGKKDYVGAVSALSEAAELGHAASQYLLAVLIQEDYRYDTALTEQEASKQITHLLEDAARQNIDDASVALLLRHNFKQEDSSIETSNLVKHYLNAAGASNYISERLVRAVPSVQGSCFKDGSCEDSFVDENVIAAVATIVAGSKPSDDETTNLLADWVREHSGNIRGVVGSTVEGGGGRGMVASKPIVSGELLLSLPADLWLSTRTAVTQSNISSVLINDEFVQSFFGPPDSGDLWSLILTLEYERHNQWSPWKPYISTLSKPESPVWWSESELTEFQSKAIADEIFDIQQQLNATWNELMPYLCARYPNMFNSDRNTLESLTWSALTVWGRSFELDRDNISETGLLPFMDLANHKSNVKTDTSWDWSTFDFVASQPALPGDEIFISYGSKPTVAFLQHYGFIPESNHGDFISVVGLVNGRNLQRTNSHPSWQTHRRSLLSYVSVSGILSADFITACAVEQNGGCESIGRDCDKRFTSKRMRCNVLDKVLDSINKVEENFPTTLEDDLDRLQGTDLSYAKYLALATRTRYKRIIVQLKRAILTSKENGTCEFAEKNIGYSIVSSLPKPPVLLERDMLVGLSMFHLEVDCSYYAGK